MSFSAIFLVLFASVLCQSEMSVLDEGCTPKMSFKIAGGVPASRSESPWMTAIYNRLKIFLCGGTLITKNYVLTAAHCIIDQTALYVRLGVKDTFCFKGQCLDSNWNDVVKATIHYDFDPTTMLNDIGVLILKKEVKFNARIWPICIMLDDKINSSGFMTYSAFGWGSTHPNNTESSPILNSITLERKNTWHCLEMDEVWEFSDKLICAGNIKGDTCKGDSGGPLVVYGKYFGKQVAVQAGIVSYGSPSCNKNGAYTDVMAYKDWIRAKTQPTTHIQELLYKECGSSWTGGIDVLHFEVFVMNRNFTGSLITDRFVITVASAFLNHPKVIKVRSIYFRSFNVEAVFKHPQFGLSSLENNIALLKLAERVPISNFISTICLDLNMNSRKSLTAILYSNQERVLGAQKVLFDKISSIECSEMIQEPLQPSQFCVKKPCCGFKFHLPGSVLGTYETINNDKKFLLLGMINFIKNDVIVVTDVTSYNNWIRTTVL